MERDPPEAPDLSELLAASVRAAWSLGVGASFELAAADEAFAPLPRHERVLACLLAGPGAERVDVEGAVGRLSSLGAAADALAEAIYGGDRGGPELAVSLVDVRWADWGRASEDERFVTAAVLALAARLPVGLDGPEVLERAEPQGDDEEDHALAALAFAVGLAARAADPGARLLCRDLLAGLPPRRVEVAPQVLRALVQGLGEGSYRAGVEHLLALTRGALADPLRWSVALLRAVIAVSTRPSTRPTLPAPLLLDALALMTEVEHAEVFVRALPLDQRVELLTRARVEFADRPPPVRTIVAQAFLAGHEQPVAGTRPEPPAALLRERSTPVLLLVLDLLARVADAVPPELKGALGRAYADHPDPAVRRALALAIPPRPHAAAPQPQAPGDVVALPPAALARDDLDRLRVALWTGESERIVELATCVPLDRRSAARESLLAALEVPNAPLRRAIVEAIGRIGGQSDGPRLIDAARRYRALEGTVAAALRELGARQMAEPLAEVYRRRLKWADDDAVDDYCAIAGPEQVMHLLRALEIRYYPSARTGAARAIARRRAHEVVFALRMAGLSDTQEGPRLAALAALHELTGSSPSAGELAGHALLFKPTDELADATERAREAGHAALPGIRRTLARGSWKRRKAACEALATIPGEDAVEVLVGCLEDPDEDVRLAALEALVQRGWAPATRRERTLQALAARRVRELVADPGLVHIPTLTQALSLGGHVFRGEVLDALSTLDGYDPSPTEAALIAAARGDVAQAALLPEGLDAVLRATDHTWQANPHRARYVRGLHDVSAEALAEALTTSETWSWRAREAVAQALAARPVHEADAAIDALGTLVLEDDDDVRRAALQSLAWYGTPRAADALARGLESPFQEDRELVGKALGTFGPRALATLERLMVEPWWEARHGAALALSCWREAVQGAVDRLVLLAVDPEHRVAQTAREGLLAHGLMPSAAAVCEAIAAAQALTIEGLEPWLGLHRTPSASPEVAHALDQLVEVTPADQLPQRLGLIAIFRAHHLALWLEQVALGEPVARVERAEGPDGAEAADRPPVAPHRHLGVRLAAADSLRALIRRACQVCQGERTVRCPACTGAGAVACPDCAGRGTVLVRCPDPGCTAHGTLRRIDSPRCPTCRGRGEVPAPCRCEGSRGRVPCSLCRAEGRLVCAGCDGTGEASFG